MFEQSQVSHQITVPPAAGSDALADGDRILTSREFEQLFRLAPGWCAQNRIKSKDPVPFLMIGRWPRYVLSVAIAHFAKAERGDAV